MRRAFIVVFVIGVLAVTASAQNVKVKVRAALYDRDLNIKPVPHLLLKLVPGTSGAEPITVQTSLEGIADLELPAGKYKVITEKPVELFDKSYRWDLEVDFSKPENMLELSNDNAVVAPIAGGREARVDELAYQYKRVKDAVVTVSTEYGAFDGLVVDSQGLVLTVQKPLQRATWMAVQIDDRRKLPAVIVASDTQHDIAVLRINPSAVGTIVAVPLSVDPGALVEGERVFTVENPGREKDKKLTTGVVSKADAEEIVSDVKISDIGNPLFNSSGNVVGIGQYAERKLRIQPIVIASAIIAEAKQKLASSDAPPSQLLPTVPIEQFPFDGLRAPGRDHWEKDVYSFESGDFYVELFTPVAFYEAASENYQNALKEHSKHSKGRVPPPTEPDYKYDVVLVVAAVPKTKAPFWENMGAGGGNRGPIIRRYKNAFEKMRILCGQKELTPIWPRRVVAGGGVGANVVVPEESLSGRYLYPYDAISPQCGTVTVQIFSAKNPDHPLETVLEPEIVTRIWQDFEPYRKMQPQQTAAPPH